MITRFWDGPLRSRDRLSNCSHDQGVLHLVLRTSGRYCGEGKRKVVMNFHAGERGNGVIKLEDEIWHPSILLGAGSSYL